jgi:hypothetical protein
MTTVLLRVDSTVGVPGTPGLPSTVSWIRPVT